MMMNRPYCTFFIHIEWWIIILHKLCSRFMILKHFKMFSHGIGWFFPLPTFLLLQESGFSTSCGILCGISSTIGCLPCPQRGYCLTVSHVAQLSPPPSKKPVEHHGNILLSGLSRGSYHAEKCKPLEDLKLLMDKFPVWPLINPFLAQLLSYHGWTGKICICCLRGLGFLS